ncbi:hypothetical protein [Mesorhizobium sp. 128a]
MAVATPSKRTSPEASAYRNAASPIARAEWLTSVEKVGRSWTLFSNLKFNDFVGIFALIFDIWVLAGVLKA